MISPPSISAIFETMRFMNSRSWEVISSAPVKRLEELLEPDDRFDVEVVGRLVHQQDVGPAEQHAGHGDAHLPAARERADVAVDPVVVEAEAVQHLAGLGFERVAAQVLVLLLHLAEAGQDAVHVVGLGRVGHRVLQGFELVVQIAQRGRCRRWPRRAPSGPTSPRRPGGSSRWSASSGPRPRLRRALPRRRSCGRGWSCRRRSDRPGRPSRRG